ncbi:hypothetical protein [Alicyclobacillus fastidiosus]|uniref:Uncharacterized protein n=1 Tax=Alicyclobacillus fastidiosus TaxID=392011 RepID=A0ABV5A8Z8_9BACL|nr:hypothetical protein [Alicyclobacillus fastidiosus]WEH10694.1 hypothetical protein PYS47_05580 [Alicyclobacillus fastidiosus]
MVGRKRAKQAEWYLEHRFEYLDAQLGKLRELIEPQNGDVNFEALKEFLEMRGRLRELEHIRKHAQDW